jgi:hypothetical protein
MSSQRQTTLPSRPTSSSSTETTSVSANGDSDNDWSSLFTIDDSDITFDGQPLSAHYEMTRHRYYAAQCSSPGSHDTQAVQERGRKRDR